MSNSIGPIPYKRKFFAPKNAGSTHDSTLVSLPKETWAFIKAIAEAEGLPVSKLINYAVDHERERKRPFCYDTDMPETKYVPSAYAEEAAKILRFLSKYPRGITLDSLCLLRRVIGIESKLDFMCGYRELRGNDEVEHRTRIDKANGFQHPEGTLFVCIKKEPVRRYPKTKTKADLESEGLAKDKEIEKLKKELLQRSKK